MSNAPRVCARPVLPDGSQGDADTYVLASDYDAVTRERDQARAQAGEANDERLNAEARWSEILADELAENRRLMDLGGALEDENFSAFVERVIAERDAGWPKLDKPARVGGGTFGVGVSAKLVVRAAQAAYANEAERRAMTKEQRHEAERNRREFWDMVNGPLEAKA